MIGITVIVWLNDQPLFERLLLPTITHGYQLAEDGSELEYDLQLLLVKQEPGRTTIGQAYNQAMAVAKHEIKVFVHQDVHLIGRTFVARLADMLTNHDIGAVGIVGSEVDTGAGFFHAPHKYQRGRRMTFWWPERAQVKIVDGLLIATRGNLRFDEGYETVHMAVEDMCMRVRENGKQVWTVDSLIEHASPGNMNEAYWRSCRRFREQWPRMLPANLTPLEVYRRKGLDPLRCTSEFEVEVV